jgi:hypothetical protein
MEVSMENKEIFDTIHQKAKELRDFCLLHKIPMMITVAREEEDETVYESEILTPTQLGVNLSDDRISKLNVAFTNGFCIRIKDDKLDNLAVGSAFSDMMDAIVDD